MRKGAAEALGGYLDFSRDTLALGLRRVEIPLEVNGIGHYISRVVDVGGRRGDRNRDPNFSAPMGGVGPFQDVSESPQWGRPLTFRSGRHVWFTPPHTFAVCRTVSPGGARDGALSDPKQIITKLHVKWGHASAKQIKRVSLDSDGGNLHLLQHVVEVLGRCEVRRAFVRAPRAPVCWNLYGFRV